MRIALCTLSAVLLSGCSWLGMGGNSSNGAYGNQACAGGQYGGTWNQGSQGYQGGQAFGGGCAGNGGALGGGGYAGGLNGYGAGAGGQGYGGQGYGAGMNGAGGAYGSGYGAGMNGYGAGAGGANGFGGAGGQGYGAGGFGPGAGGYGAGGFGPGANGAVGGGFGPAGAGAYGPGANGAGGYGTTTGYGPGAMYGAGNGAGFGTTSAYGSGNGMYGNGPVTLGAGTSYGAAVGSVAGGQYAQYASNGMGGYGVNGGVQTIQGAPIYVRRPYPVAFNAPRLRVGGSAMPLGLAGFAGLSQFASGEVFTAKAAGFSKNADGTPNVARSISALDGIEYKDAFNAGNVFGGALEYDVSRGTTVFAGANMAEYEGQNVQNGTITDNLNAVTEDGNYQFGDMKTMGVEAGVRQYVGNNMGFRPYVSAAGGFMHNDEVTMTTTSHGGTVVTSPEKQVFIAEGWQPTAAGMIGAEMAMGNNAAIGVETGLRWTSDKSTNTESDNTWSIPVQVRGRLAF